MGQICSFCQFFCAETLLNTDAAAYTWALGEGACVYFGDLMGGKKPDPQKIQSVMQEAFQSAKERFKGIK
ncbi:hypothetical protein [Coleofasciculus sp. E1-EBD-02]|uniref:hypothetical protein n=1 Tax=Coleofasciculus sp. E1-EBD-02 TaxID=3068481 RepID=UPI0032F3DFFD